jgi:hypothetical protein
MNKASSLAILGDGAILLIFGTNAYNSSSFDIISNVIKDTGKRRKIGRKAFENDRLYPHD